MNYLIVKFVNDFSKKFSKELKKVVWKKYRVILLVIWFNKIIKIVFVLWWKVKNIFKLKFKLLKITRQDCYMNVINMFLYQS